jgi:hypothetical protein
MACPSLSEVSNFDQTAAAKERTLVSGFGAQERDLNHDAKFSESKPFL